MTEAGSAFLAWIGQALVVGAGWYVVHRLTVNRDIDKARRETVVKSTDSLSEDIGKLLLEARTYHSNARDISAELRLKMALQDVAIKVNGLSDIFLEAPLLAQARSQILALRKATTGNHFEDEHLQPLDNASPQFQLMAEAALELKRSLLKIKNRQFNT